MTQATVPGNIIRIAGDLNPNTLNIRYNPGMPAQDFLAEVYRHILDYVPQYSYGQNWVLREVTTGRIYDCGSPWARATGVQADLRPIGQIGIRGGSVLQAVSTG
jgi:hypothetical protein